MSLINACKLLKDSNGTLIAEVQVKPISLFNNSPNLNLTLDLQVWSSNQGLAVSNKQNIRELDHIEIVNDTG
jgi:hypothetical protein